MSQTHQIPQYSLTEELWHAISHGAGVILSIGGLSWMLYVSIAASDPWRITASIVYGISLISLFLASTLYHAFHASPNKHIFKLLDHCAIYVLIAGTYTPFLLVAMRNDTGWWMSKITNVQDLHSDEVPGPSVPGMLSIYSVRARPYAPDQKTHTFGAYGPACMR